jgi:hypothetical protein
MSQLELLQMFLRLLLHVPELALQVRSSLALSRATVQAQEVQ